jgi:hypothetical protein
VRCPSISCVREFSIILNIVQSSYICGMNEMNAEECDLPPFLLQLRIPIITNRGLNIYYIYMFATAVMS